jgi:hypothetical protein
MPLAGALSADDWPLQAALILGRRQMAQRAFQRSVLVLLKQGAGACLPH